MTTATTTQETAGTVTMHGSPIQLVGHRLTVGDKAPDFLVVDNAMKPVKGSDLYGRPRVLVSVPSLDTPVCNTEARRFNLEAGKLPDIKVLVVSMDLPFAQKRWCAAAGVESVQTLSDYQQGAFGSAYGVMMKDVRLLGRAVFVVDSQDTIRYIQVVDEVTNEPDYDAALAAARALATK